MDETTPRLSIGFPRMHKERGEVRDYLPSLVAGVAAYATQVVIESGIGTGIGYADADYLERASNIRAGTNEEAFDQDVVVTLRSPETEEFEKLRPGSVLVAMLHYSTRPARVRALAEREIEAISLDGIVDDSGRRLVVNAPGVAWNGVGAAFDALEASWPALHDPHRSPLQVTVLGTGAIGRHAIDAASKAGGLDRRARLMAETIHGTIVRAVGRDVTRDGGTMRSLLATTDILVDASQRDDPSLPLIPNGWIAILPPHAVVCDLVVDPYLLDAQPPTVRSIEGIPRGNLDKYIYLPDDDDWCDTIATGIPTDHRRITSTCYSWPGVRPKECMDLYCSQLLPLLQTLMQAGGASGLHTKGSYLERALHRAWLRTWLSDGQVGWHGPRGALSGMESS
jgi:alanine dehydrogenase